MTTQPPPLTHVDPDTFEARWDRWVAKGIKGDEVQSERLIGAVVVFASTAAIVAAWVFTLR